MLGHMYTSHIEWDCTWLFLSRLVLFFSMFKTQMSRSGVINKIQKEQIEQCFVLGCMSIHLWVNGSL